MSAPSGAREELRLLLLRHAKSDWSGQIGDHDRPLAPRGKKTAPRMGAYMRAKAYEPALALCSTAERAKQTLDLALSAFAVTPPIRFERALYLAEWPQLLEEIRGAPDALSPLLLVGHNPGLEHLAVALALEPQSAIEKARAQKLAQKFPTGALAVLDFEIDNWTEVKPGLGRLSDFARPKDVQDHNY